MKCFRMKKQNVIFQKHTKKQIQYLQYIPNLRENVSIWKNVIKKFTIKNSTQLPKPKLISLYLCTSQNVIELMYIIRTLFMNVLIKSDRYRYISIIY